MKKVCVIGGGAAGLMAAYAAAEKGHFVTLFEKNEKLGKKIYITGKGRCNFTNDVPAEDFLQNVVRGKKFLTGAIYAFSPQKTINLLENYGLSIKIERGNRAFPTSDHASDVTKTLEKACKSAGVSIHLNEKVEKIITSMSDIIPMSDIAEHTTPDIGIMPRVVKVKTEKNEYDCDEVIVATGGISYPSTGSTGDGYLFAQECGHTVTDLKTGLCGLNLHGSAHTSLQGLALKNVTFTVKNGNKTVYEEFGEMLFTHFGVSGPIILSASSMINRLPLEKLTATVDLKPALDEQTLDKRLLRDFEKYKNKQISNAFVELLPQKLIPVVLSVASVSANKAVNAITKEERARLVKTLKAFPLKLRSLRGFEEAIITSGGVELSEINPKTMESKRVKGLRFCGEVLDVDAFTGGFNMQIAFATGYAAGKNIE
ncbi:MAG: NAD(P)/FAD-dependent oxidoreductase [Clostridiales bacterium]|nr:NAD(P)/FAD-dependent oxidoreductase [Clostridiales bacterium]MBE5746678.1 NAD(P)/FAD-dependent oxidoreductase [Clostridiales bacterium]